jgi:hypothetical protein
VNEPFAISLMKKLGFPSVVTQLNPLKNVEFGPPSTQQIGNLEDTAVVTTPVPKSSAADTLPLDGFTEGGMHRPGATEAWRFKNIVTSNVSLPEPTPVPILAF